MISPIKFRHLSNHLISEAFDTVELSGIQSPSQHSQRPFSNGVKKPSSDRPDRGTEYFVDSAKELPNTKRRSKTYIMDKHRMDHQEASIKSKWKRSSNNMQKDRKHPVRDREQLPRSHRTRRKNTEHHPKKRPSSHSRSSKHETRIASDNRLKRKGRRNAS